MPNVRLLVGRGPVGAAGVSLTRVGFAAIESGLNAYCTRVPGGDWYYINVLTAYMASGT